METRRYIFSGQYLQCPQCGAAGKYRQYYDTFTRNFIAEECGTCFRASCGYNLTPPQYYQHHPDQRATPPATWTPPPPPPISYIPAPYVTDRQARPPFKSHLLIWLQSMFSVDSIAQAAQTYHVGEDGQGNVLWPYVDTQGRVHEVKMQGHNIGNGHRLPWCRTIHKELRDLGVLAKDTRPSKCLFGEHLLRCPDTRRKVCVVESEKTCLMMSLLMPDYIWLATGGCSGIGLLRNVAKHLGKFSRVVIFPDAGQFLEWRARVEAIGLPNVVVSNICEGHPANTDLADIYVAQWLEHPSPEAPSPEAPEAPPPPQVTAISETVVALCPLHRLERLTANNPAFGLLVEKLDLEATDDDFELF